MRVVVHGARGSTPAPGRAFEEVGGNTSCVSLTPAGSPVPTLLLDAGTGLTSVTAELAGAPFVGDILLTHLHWDHVQGLPFFDAGDRDDAKVRLRFPAQNGARPGVAGAAEALLAGSMSPPHFPIGPDGLKGCWSFDVLEPGRFEAGGFRVSALQVPHKGGRTFGYRAEADGMSVAYLPDYDAESDDGAGVRLSAGVDLLLHGGMFAEDERTTARAYGHATVADACRTAADAGAHALVLLHHAPHRTDSQVEALAARYADRHPPPIVGHEGDVVLDSGSSA
jgi:ribonuclease BN (tRNA processing enzyme)